MGKYGKIWENMGNWNPLPFFLSIQRFHVIYASDDYGLLTARLHRLRSSLRGHPCLISVATSASLVAQIQGCRVSGSGRTMVSGSISGFEWGLRTGVLFVMDSIWISCGKTKKSRADHLGMIYTPNYMKGDVLLGLHMIIDYQYS